MKVGPRERRILAALTNAPHSRHVLDGLVGAENTPQHVSVLRTCGWDIACDKIAMKDRDGKTVRPGVYRFASETERQRALAFLKGEAPEAVQTTTEGPINDVTAETTANDRGAQHVRAS